MTMNNNNGGGAFNGTPPSISGASLNPGSSPQLRAAMQKILSAGNHGQAGHIAMQGVVGSNGLSSQNAQTLIAELAKALKKQAELIEGMQRYGAKAQHVEAEEKKFKNIESALQALQNQQKVVMNRAANFDPNFIDNLNKIQQAFQNPVIQRVAANLAAASSGNNNPGGSGDSGRPPAGGGGRGGVDQNNPGSNLNNNPQFAAFMRELSKLRSMSEEYSLKQKGHIQSSLTPDDLKNVKNVLTGTLQSLLQDPSLSNDDRAVVMGRFNSAVSRFESAYKEQAEATKRFVSFASGAITTLQLGQLAQKMFLSDPFQYETMPAISAIGNTGKMGEVLSAGLFAREGWELEQNQAAFGVGAGMMGAGALMGGRGGLALGVGGAALGALGLSGGGSVLRDFIGRVTGTMTSDTTMGNAMAEKIMQPQTLVDKGTMSKALYTAFGGNPFKAQNAAAGDNFTNLGNYINRAVSPVGEGTGKTYNTASGNAYIDKFWKMGMDGTGGLNALNLGMDADQSGAFLANIAGNLRDKTMRQSMNLANYALKMGTGLGVDPNTYAESFRSMQAVGMTNLKKVNNESLSVFADAKGEVSQFAANVLHPALMKVTSSLAMRNVSMSAEKLSENVNAFQKYLMTDLKGTELGKRAAADPSLIGGMMEGFSGATGKFTQSTAGIFAARGILGVDPYDLIRGKNDPEMFMRVVQNSIKNLGFNKSMFHTVDGKLQVKNEYGKHMEQFSELLGQDFSKMEQLVGAIVTSGNNGSIRLEDIKMQLDKDGKLVETATGKKVREIGKTPEMQAAEQIAQQATEFGKNVQAVQSRISDLQTYVLNYVKSTKFLKDAEEGIRNILREAEKLLKTPSDSGNSEASVVRSPQVTSTPGTATVKQQFSKSEDITNYFGRMRNIFSDNKVTDKEKKELINLIGILKKKAGSTSDGESFLNLIKPGDAETTARNMIKFAEDQGIIQPNVPSGVKPGQKNAVISSDPRGILQASGSTLGANLESNWGRYYTNRGPGSLQNADTNQLLSDLGLSSNLKPNLSNLRGTIDNKDADWMAKNLGVNASSIMSSGKNTLTPAEENSIVNNAWEKTQAKLKASGGKDKGAQAGLALINSIANTKNPEKREELVKLLAMSLANTKDGVTLAAALLGKDGKAYSAIGSVLGAAENYGLDGNTTPTYSAPATPKNPPKPTKPTQRSTSSSGGGKYAPNITAMTTGSDQVVITIDGQGAATAVRRYVDAQVSNAGNYRKVTV